MTNLSRNRLRALGENGHGPPLPSAPVIKSVNVTAVLMQVGNDIANLLVGSSFASVRAVLEKMQANVAALGTPPLDGDVRVMAVTSAIADCQDAIRAQLRPAPVEPKPDDPADHFIDEAPRS